MKLITGRYRYANATDMYTYLGVTQGSLPAEGMPERVIDGVRVYVRPLPPKTGMRRNWAGLRVMAICDCGRHLPVGRMHQHKCTPAFVPEANVPNLDTMDASTLMDFWSDHQNGRNVRGVFPNGGRGTRLAMGQLANYAANIATAKRLRLKGEITTATVYEKIAERIYQRLPTWARW
jgi:hypothetical protein